MLSSCRFALIVASLGLAARADAAVLSATNPPAPAPTGMRIAMASTPSGTTRWSDVSLPARAALGWLVPVRSGAVVDWAPGPWLDALDGATAPRVVSPTASRVCGIMPGHGIPPRWSPVWARQDPAPFAVHTSAADAKEWARTHRFLLSAAQTSRVDELYASGWQVVAIELAPSDTARTSATLRVTDDGGPVLPLALTGHPNGDTPLTVFVIGAGTGSIGTTVDIDPSRVLWGYGNTYASYRDAVVMGGVWLRESATHDALFVEAPRAGMPVVRSAVTSYFEDSDCAAGVRARGSSTYPAAASELTCGDRTDLARALAGTAPVDAVVTRLVGVQPAGALGTNASIEVEPAAEHPVAFRAGGYVSCDPAEAPSTTDPPSDDSPSKPGPPPSESSTTGIVYVPSDGCGGGGGTVITSDDSSDDDGDDSGWDSADSSESCSSDTSDGWDSSDSGDGCSSDTSDGWDTSDSSTCSASRTSKRRGPSPLSRLVLFAVALLLPLRRRLRPATGDRS